MSQYQIARSSSRNLGEFPFLKVFVTELLAQLRTQNILTQGYRFAQSTRKGLISHIRTWFFFALFFNQSAIPATEESLCMFLELMSLTCGYPHCKAILSTVKYLHAALGYSIHHTFSLDCTLQGLKRRLARTPFQVLPIDPAILRLMYRGLNINKKPDLALWCSFLTAFFCLFRKANTVPQDNKFDPNFILTRDNIGIDRSEKMVYIYVGFSKTNQYRKKDRCIPIPKNNDPCLDLYRHIDLLFSTVNASDSDPAFTYGKNQFINYKVFTVRLKELLKSAGLEPSLYSGHSFRRGGASFLFSIGGSQLMVQVLGDWSSMVYTRYLYMSADDRMAAQNLMATYINSEVGQS